MRFHHWVIIGLGIAVAGLLIWTVLNSDAGDSPREDVEPPAPRSAAPTSPPSGGAPVSAPVSSPDRQPTAAPTPSVQGPRISGVVVDAAGQAVVGADVAVYHPDRGAKRTVTDDDGAFVVGALDQSAYRVSARKDGFNEAVLKEVPTGSLNLVLTLQPASSVSGTVLNARTAAPVPVFEVAYLAIPPANHADWMRRQRNPQTPWVRVENETGAFALNNIASGAPFAVAARAAGLNPILTLVGALAPGERREGLNIALPRESRVLGVVETSDRAPIPGAAIYLGPEAEDPVLARTGADGRFEIKGMENGQWTLTAAHPDFVSANEDVRIAWGQDTQVSFALSRGGALTGTVSRGENPLADWRVSVHARLGRGMPRKTVHTGPQGEYLIEGIPPGTVEVMAAPPDQSGESEVTVRPLQRQAIVEDGAVTTVDFRFPAAYASLEGAITINGMAPAWGQIKGTVAGESGDSFFSRPMQADGTYCVDDIVPGTAWVEFRARTAAGSQRRENVQIEFAEGGTVRHDVTFDADTLVFGTVSPIAEGDGGQVLALTGEPDIASDDLEALLRLESIQVAETDIGPEGAYRLEGLKPGDYTILAVVFPTESEQPLENARLAWELVTVPAQGEVSVNLSFGP